jgi:hypothetical protein
LRIREDRRQTFSVPKVLRHSLTKYGELSRTDQYGDKPTRKSPGKTKFLVRKTLYHSLICREEVCALVRLFARRSKTFIVPQPPCHFLYMRQRGRESERIFVPKSLCHCL